MEKIIVEADTVARLEGLRESVELVDAAGRYLGRFVPAARLVPQISEEEITRRERQGGGRTLAEILTDLEKRA